MKNTKPIVCLGEALIDFTPAQNGAYIPNAGGAPYNVAACAAKFGANAIFVGSVGKDVFGSQITNTALSCGVDARGIVAKADAVTTHSFVSLDKNGDRDFVFCRDADTRLCFKDVDASILESCAVLHIGSLSLTAHPIRDTTLCAMNKAKSAGAIISFDPNYRAALWGSEACFVAACLEVLPMVDILKVSEEEAVLMTGTVNPEAALEALATDRLVFITCGEKGAYYAKGSAFGFVPAIKAKTVDTTGAGDIFIGVVLSEIVKRGILPRNIDKGSLHNITEKACLCASKSTEKLGAVSSIPEICN